MINNHDNIFIVYKILNVSTTNWVSNGLFGHDNGGYDKFIAFTGMSGSTLVTGNLVVSGAPGSWFHMGPSNFKGYAPRVGYKTKANAGELNKWICLSIHWIDNTTNGSSIWCNGQNLYNFTPKSSTGSTQMTFGDLDPSGIAPLYCNIAFFSLHKDKVLSADDIRLQHYVLCNRYSIDTLDFM